MHENGLVFAGQPGQALTWMDGVVNGKPVTPRVGYAVEINALWYNAVCFCLDLAKRAKEEDFIREWEKWPSIIKESFTNTFWDSKKSYLADVVNDGNKDWSIRPNQIIAVSMDFSPLEKSSFNRC
jgi:predicted glycogen debranching enzyme